MIRRFLILVLAPLVLAAAPVQPAPDPQFSPDRFKAHVAFLADDLLEGRETASRGEAIAGAYVAAQFAAMGLMPGGAQGSWYLPVPLRSARLAARPARLSVSGAGATRGWTNGTEVILGPSMSERVQDLSAPAVFVGYGIDAPDSGLDDYRGLDVRGKMVVAFAGAPADISSEKAAYFTERKAPMAAARGAIALVTIGTEESDRTTPWSRRLRAIGSSRMTWIGPDGQPENDAPGLRATATLGSAAAERLFAGAARSYADLRAEAARKDGRPRGFPLATRIRIERWSDWTDSASRETIGILPGSDPALSREYVILTAHIDHLGMRALDPASPQADRIYNGAIDNAGGIATMLEVARAFAESPRRPRRSVMFIALTAEEKGLIGSEYFARNPTVPIGSIAAAVNLDMPMLTYDFTDVIAFGAEHSSVGRAVDDAARSMGIAVSPDPMPEEHVFVRSDHYSFVREGVPAVMLATGYANGGEAKWKDFFATNYHNVGDDLSQPIHWEAGARFARLNYLIARELADSDARPRWYEGDYFGDLYAPGAPRAPPPASLDLKPSPN
jgi:hypothetical protein